MKIIYVLLILVLLVACETTTEETQEQTVQEQVEKEQEIEPELVRQPLSVSLSADKTTGELSFDANLKCKSSGSDETHEYSWSADNNVELEICKDENCHLHVTGIGIYEVTCTVSDSEETISKTLILEVTKKKVYVDSVVNFGDSLTFGHGLENPEKENWAYLFSQEFENSESYNYAVSGATTFNVRDGQLISYEKEDVDEKEKLVFLWVGANDIKNFILLEDFAQSYRFIVDKISKIPNARFIIINVPDVSKLSVADDIEQDINDLIGNFGIQIAVKELSKDVVGTYNNAILSIANEYEVPVIDMFSYQEDFNDSMVTDDRFHPNELGHTLIVEKVQEELNIIYPEIEFI